MNTDDFTGPEREALLDLAVLAMYADGHLASAEDTQVRRLLGTLGLESTYERNRQFDAAVSRVRPHLGSNEAACARATELTQCFQSSEHRQTVCAILGDLIASDNQVAAQENLFLAAVREACAL